MNTNLNANSSWTIESIEEAMDAESEQTLGHLTLGFGRAVLPSARDGSPVRVSAETALEGLQRYQGDCWVAHRPTGGYLLLGEDDPVAAEPLPEWLVQRVLSEPLAEEITRRGLVLWWHPMLAGLWLGVVYSDGRAAGVDVDDYSLRVGWADGGEAAASAFVDEAPAWAMRAISIAREVLGV